MAYDANTIAALSVTTPTENASYVDEVNDALREIKRALQRAYAVKAITDTDSPYTADTEYSVILANATSGAITVNLPTAASIAGRTYTIKNTGDGSNAVTVDPNGSETIDGDSTVELTNQYNSIKIVSDGTNWVKDVDTMENGARAFFGQAAAPAGWAIDNTNLVDSAGEERMMCLVHSGQYVAGDGAGGSQDPTSMTTASQKLNVMGSDSTDTTDRYITYDGSNYARTETGAGGDNLDLLGWEVGTATLTPYYQHCIACTKG